MNKDFINYRIFDIHFHEYKLNASWLMYLCICQYTEADNGDGSRNVGFISPFNHLTRPVALEEFIMYKNICMHARTYTHI